MKSNVFSKMFDSASESPKRQSAKKKGSTADQKETSKEKKMEAQEQTVTAEDILVEKNELFGKLYVISLADMFKIIGERSGRLSDAIELICERILDQRLDAEGTFGYCQHDAYFFRFGEAHDERGWKKAVAIVDEIGKNILGERYVTSQEEPMIRLAVVDAGEIKDAEGRLDPEKVEDALSKVKDKSRSAVLMDWESFKGSSMKFAEAAWETLEHETERRKKAKKRRRQKSDWLRRESSDRRHALRPYNVPDRREGFDRRGRGY